MSKIFYKILIKKSNKKTIPNLVSGFTLIELLVVIFLMGLLAFIVLASLDSAREKGREAQMQSLLASLRAQAERYYNAHGTYFISFNNNVCSSSPSGLGFGGVSPDNDGWVSEPVGLLKDFKDTTSNVRVRVPDNIYNSSAGGPQQITCHSDLNYWVLEVPKSDSTDKSPNMDCVDNISSIVNNRNFYLQSGPAWVDCNNHP